MIALLDPKTHFSACREIFHLLTKRRQLLWAMVKREIGEQYAGHAIGTWWAIGHPLFLMMLYVVVFGYVFKIRLVGVAERPADYTIYMLSGLIPWMAFQACLSKGVGAITGNSNLVKQVVFPIEVLPVKTVIATSFTLAISLSLMSAYCLVVNAGLVWTYWLLPVLVFFQVLAMIGAAYILAALGVYCRDLKEFVLVLVSAGIYTIPVFYLPEMVPTSFRPLLWMNPFSHMVWCYQDVLYFGSVRHPLSWGIFIFLSTLSFYGGYRIFRKLKVYFGSLL